MKKAQAVKFWTALHENTSVKETISAFANKKGYDSKATLRRYTEADAGFRGGQSSQAVAGKGGWSPEYVNKIRGWWEGEFLKTTTLSKPMERTVEHGLRGTQHKRKMRELTQNLMGEITLPELPHRFIVESKLGSGSRVMAMVASYVLAIMMLLTVADVVCSHLLTLSRRYGEI